MADEKIKAAEVMSDSELDGVAGGSKSENVDLLYMMLELDPSATKQFLMNWDQQSYRADLELSNGVTQLLNNYIKGAGMKDVHFTLNFTQGGGNNYIINGEQVSHKEFMNHLNGGF